MDVAIAGQPEAGETKVGDLAGVRVYAADVWSA